MLVRRYGTFDVEDDTDDDPHTFQWKGGNIEMQSLVIEDGASYSAIATTVVCTSGKIL